MCRNWFARQRPFQRRSSAFSTLRPQRASKPSLEPLEDRLVPTVVTVTDVGDAIAVDGMVTLREAITSINQGAPVNGDVPSDAYFGFFDKIVFNIPGSGAHSIAPLSALPAITKPVTIDGYTQPGSSVNTKTNGDNAILKIELFNGLSPAQDGLTIKANNCTIAGLNIKLTLNAGIAVQGSNNTFIGNFIGTNRDGTVLVPNQIGIEIKSGTKNFIGNGSPAGRNLISGGGYGIVDRGTNNFIQGNYIGTDVSSTVKLGCVYGVALMGSKSAKIGGAGPGLGNVIGGSLQAGILLVDAAGATIQGNSIGVSAFGSDVGNSDSGIYFAFSQSNSILIGGGPGAGNQIAFNGLHGGITCSFNGSLNNRFLGNSIFANQGPAISFGNSNIVPNDIGDADDGPNNLQNFPVLNMARADKNSTTIAGTLNSMPNRRFTIEFFNNPSAAASQIFLGSILAYTDASGNAPVFFTTNTIVASGTVTATATDAIGNTSQLADAVNVTLHPFNTANANFVFQAFLDLLHRPSDAGGQQYFTNGLNTGSSRASVVASLQNSAEYRNLEVADLFRRLLQRAPDAGGLSAFTNVLAQGGTLEQIEATFLGSLEYFQGSEIDSFVSKFVIAAFGEALGRNVDSGALDYFTNRILMGVPRSTVAGELLISSEGSQHTVDKLFQQLLHRAPDAGAKSFFGNQLQQGLRDEQLVAILMSSDEYFGNV